MSIADKLTADFLALEIEQAERILAEYRRATSYIVIAEDNTGRPISGARVTLRADEIGLVLYKVMLQRLVFLVQRLADLAERTRLRAHQVPPATTPAKIPYDGR